MSALRARRCYGTSGPRIFVEASADGHPVGAAFDAATAPRISVSVAGTAPVERIDCFRGTELIATFPERLPRAEGPRAGELGRRAQTAIGSACCSGTDRCP